MMNKQIFIVGCGGHSKVVTDALVATQRWDIVGYIDEVPKSSEFLGCPVFNSLTNLYAKFPSVKSAFVAIGDNEKRRLWYKILEDNNHTLPWIAHPTACLSPTASVGAGTLIGAKSFLGASSKVGRGVIVNTGAIIDHDCEIGDFSHMSQGAIACGGVVVGSNVLIGPGRVVEKLSKITHSVVT
ncbi:hypothetical protein AZI87_17280 [Bdellovibrio bacteriovorus]|uniref:PglD N-terminal domain-containing protein n=1 Tax=Bdellovibrio bacteriovorus TaxID=959 RepID=A0A162FTX3_BDEBC|nr:acetyltransferase [Bdellovibrio bacteriovorus]KYG62283.1 hypothetical protein AZI87_17280 [Bdellovibrio bacteriovorus]